MAAPQRGLGRGLGALIPTAQTPAPAKAGAQSGTQPSSDGEVLLAEYAEIPVDEIVPNPRQPRTIFD
jgi:ParB family chromosome partitioning protein